MSVNPLGALKQMAPHARENYLDAISQSAKLFEEHDITTTQRMAHFLAQAMQETGAFTVLRENMNYSARGRCSSQHIHSHQWSFAEAFAIASIISCHGPAS